MNNPGEYTIEEKLNSITHGIGVGLSIAGICGNPDILTFLAAPG